MRAALAIVLASAACSAFAVGGGAPRIEIITGDDTDVTRRISADLSRRLAPLAAGAIANGRKKLCIALGPVALRDALARSVECVQLSAYTSSPVWRAVAGHLPPSQASAVYAEPSPADQLQLVSLLYRRPTRVVAIVGPDTAYLRPALSAGAELYEFARGDDINRVLNRMAQAEVLLATPDSAVYTPENFRNILLSSYRHNQGVIGFSADMVKAGALASTYSDIEDINAQVAEVAAAYLASGVLAPPQFPRYFRTIINEAVARSLNIKPDDAARSFARRPPQVAP
ncbi:hypothetical protein ACFSQU_10150 [Massilia sp. GCM10020059]|uniref:ABC transporter substrate-binding protein n=1 Tax=Massilia agrisoli TaxID=2892444 RepID=A0ABS8IVQ0_9BURK|nr:hypothetical protein [Massilia agrisoli]